MPAPDELSKRRQTWQSKVRAARAAFDELRHAERAYLAEMERVKERRLRYQKLETMPVAKKRAADLISNSNQRAA